MKRNLIILVMMVALAAVAISCQKENMAKGTFTATMEKTASQGGKVAFDGTDFLWVVDDAITAVRQSSTANNSYATGIYTANSVSSDNVATLGHLTDGGGADVTGDGYTGTFYAYSPASIYNEKTATTNSITLPATYYTDGNGNLIGAPMYAEANGQSRTLKFKNLCGMMCLKLATPGLNTYVTKIKITTDEKIQGLFNVTFDNVPTIQASGTTDDAEKTVVLKTLTNISTAHDFFIPLPENTYNSLEIKIYTADGRVCTKTMNTTNNNNHLNIHRSQYTVVDLTQTSTGATATLNFTGATGAKGGYFSVSPNKKVQFSQGNLQYRAKEPSPGTRTNIWKFADNQYDRCFPNNISSDVRVDYYNNTSTQWVDLFYWGSTCCTHSDNSTNDNYPWNLPSSSSFIITNQDITSTDYDWGSFCDITNGGDGEWYTMTQAEWEYLFNHGQWAKAKVCNVNGIILLPDYWVCPIDITPLTCGTSTQFSSNTVNSDRWSKLETSGAVFLPITGELYQYIINHTTNGYYWTSSYYNENYANRIIITNSSISSSTSDYAVWRSCFAVRLVTE